MGILLGNVLKSKFEQEIETVMNRSVSLQEYLVLVLTVITRRNSVQKIGISEDLVRGNKRNRRCFYRESQAIENDDHIYLQFLHKTKK